jgi:GNAT superfamily N-acetyltransferase
VALLLEEGEEALANLGRCLHAGIVGTGSALDSGAAAALNEAVTHRDPVAAPPRVPIDGRVRGLLRSLRLVHARSGVRGLGVLVVARALPEHFSYRRGELLRRMVIGVPHPELEPRVIRELDSEVERFYADLAASGEPDARVFDRAALAERFAIGLEMWFFHVGGRIALGHWLARDHVRFAGVSLPLAPDECAGEATVTLPEFRRQGITRDALRHVGSVLLGEGVTKAYWYINTSNRGVLEAALHAGAEPVATVRVVTVLRRRWIRADPASPDAASWLEERGLAPARWAPIGS